ncbi:hypothetical protein GCM10010435_28880 [Winogradskya consettensis]|uniref:Uncharacterized protein n=1 Tax=Winogradskya consettensis TaxID=113560 RepID=A0A919VLR5_9ACTN|nr:hypothetical protein Aco04nite_22630 [Actinoplanes consettensis]
MRARLRPGLQDVEHPEPHTLLDLRVTVQFDVRGRPEVVEVCTLLRGEDIKSGGRGGVPLPHRGRFKINRIPRVRHQLVEAQLPTARSGPPDPTGFAVDLPVGAGMHHRGRDLDSTALGAMDEHILVVGHGAERAGDHRAGPRIVPGPGNSSFTTKSDSTRSSASARTE